MNDITIASYNELLNDLTFREEEGAKKVYTWMRATIAHYGFASFADLLKMCGRTVTDGDEKVGWTKLESAVVLKVGSVYKISFPEMINLEDILNKAVEHEVAETLENAGFDVISHPSHYTQGRKYEPRKVIVDWGLGFYLGNTVKYISRAGRKGDAVEDLEKAKQYLEWEIERLKGEDND